MPKHLIVSKLRDRDWEDFHKFLLDRRTSNLIASRWLVDRGYNISLSAVGRYRQHLDRSSVLSVDPGPVPYESAKLMPFTRRILAGLGSRELVAVAMFAKYLASGGSRRNRVSSYPGR